MKILIQNGHVIDTTQEVNGIQDVLIEDGKIIKIGKIVSQADHTVVDASGKYVLPGFVDAHCHLRDPGQEYKEDIATGTRSAAMGGFTSIACMPNTKPVIDTGSLVSYVINKAKAEGVVNVFPIGAVTKGQEGKELAEMGDMKAAGAVAVSDDGMPVESADMMKKAIQYAAMFDLTVISHCEDTTLSEDGVMNEGYHSTLLGLKGIPTAAEDVMIARDILVAEYLHLPVHIAHVSTKGGVELVRQAKKRGVKVSCETCPQYFALTDAACLNFNTYAKVYPPLRTQEDLEAICAGLQDGTIDVIATDHAPHHMDEKKVEFAQALKGLVGFETAFGLAVTHLVKKGILTMADLVKTLSVHPARLLKINKGTLAVGADADVVVVDTEEEWTVDVAAFASRSKNSPFQGHVLQGRVVHTLVGGRFVVKDKLLQV